MEQLPTIHTVNAVKRLSKSTGLETDGVTWVVRFTHLQHERTQGAGNIQLFTVTSSLTGTEAGVVVREDIRGSNPLHTEINGLLPGVPYYVRVHAFNGAGYSVPSDVAHFTPREQPSSPTNALLFVDSATSLQVTFNSPAYTGGAAVSAFKVETYSSSPIYEVQAISTSSEGGITEIQAVETIANANNINNFSSEVRK